MTLRQTPLYDRHVERDARFTDFAGWEMPVEFTSITDEHAAVRETVGVFDVSHMGQVEISGTDAGEVCQRLTTANVDRLTPGDAQYTTILRTDGTIIDDAILYRLGEVRYLLVPNAGQDQTMTERWRSHADDWDLEVEVANRTTDWGMLAVQGPDALDRVPGEHADRDPMTIVDIEIADVGCWCATTGYTGESGVELLIPWPDTPQVAAAIDGQPCGLGARDTLRLEMGFVLAGNEFDDEGNRRTPLEAGLDFVVDLEAEPAFVGQEALREQRERGPDARLVGLEMLERGIPRHGYDITDGAGEVIGIVTSGTMSPTLGEPIGLGYIASTHAEAGSKVAISVRNAEKRASIVTPPFIGSGR